jgi:acetyl esterase/lipase
MTSDGGLELLRLAGDGGWELFSSVAMEDTLTTAPVELDETGRTLYMTDSRGRDTAALVAVGLETGARRLLAEDARADAGEVMLHLAGSRRSSCSPRAWAIIAPRRAALSCRPLLIGEGANAPRVKEAESSQIVQAMQEKGIPVTYVLYPDEGHGFARPENWLSFNAIAEIFSAESLGGRCLRGTMPRLPAARSYLELLPPTRIA